ncbi:MAG: hypothetical protein JYX80_11535 [Candidatus Scalindua sediminis]|nr:hypothetical protein [Candidatus Scalindua sediminis]
MTSKYTNNRPTIPVKIRRDIAIESGHSCAIKNCNEHTYNEYHHIDGNRENNNPDNLIYLCDKHHKMAHKDVIDKKALREYKIKNSGYTNLFIKDEFDDESKYKINIDKFRPLDVLENKFTPNSKEMGIKLYEIWRENSYKYTQKDFSRVLNISEDEIHSYFSGKNTLNLQQILMITEVFNISKSHFFEATYWMRKAYWKEDIVKYSILSTVHPKSKIAEVADQGHFYSSILRSYTKKICEFHMLLYGEKKENPFQNSENIEISSELKRQLEVQYYKVLEQYPEFDNNRGLLNYEKILKHWFFASSEYIARILVEGIKKIDITNINNPVVTCWFEEDIKNQTVTAQEYNKNIVTMEKA